MTCSVATKLLHEVTDLIIRTCSSQSISLQFSQAYLKQERRFASSTVCARNVPSSMCPSCTSHRTACCCIDSAHAALVERVDVHWFQYYAAPCRYRLLPHSRCLPTSTVASPSCVRSACRSRQLCTPRITSISMLAAESLHVQGC